MANEVKQVRGAVVATAQNSSERYGVRVGDDWFDGVGEVPPGVERGAEVEVDYFESTNGSRTFRNVKWIKVLDPAEEAGAEAPADDEAARDGRIRRAVALKCAVQLASGREDAEPESVLQLATELERWLRARSE